MINESNLVFTPAARPVEGPRIRHGMIRSATLLALVVAVPVTLAWAQESGAQTPSAPAASQQPAAAKQSPPASPAPQKKGFDPYYFPGRPATRPKPVPVPAPAGTKSAGPANSSQATKGTASTKDARAVKRADAKKASAAKAATEAKKAAAAKQSVATHQAPAASAAAAHAAKPASAAPKAPEKARADVRGKPGPGNDKYRTCEAGDDSPDGTISNGWRKVSFSTPMGSSCHWEKVE